MSKERGRYLTELRRSGASSPQNRRHELTDREAIDEEMEELTDWRQQAAEELAKEFGNDVSEWLV